MKTLLMSFLTLSFTLTSAFATSASIVPHEPSQDEEDISFSNLLLKDMYKAPTISPITSHRPTASTLLFTLDSNRIDAFFRLVTTAINQNMPLMPQLESSRSFLHEAFRKLPRKHIPTLLSKILSAGIDINTQTFSGHTFLHMAVLRMNDNLPAINWLIEKGARTDLPATIDGKPYLPLCTALCKKTLPNREEIVELLKTGLTAEQIAEAEAEAEVQKQKAEAQVAEAEAEADF